MYPHRIRLRGPWEVDAVSPACETITTRVTMPVRWKEVPTVGHGGVVRWRRRFGLPRQLDDWERVWLVCQGFEGRASWSLNGNECLPHSGGDGMLETEITSLLHERNELTIEMTPGDADQWVWEELALEIRSRAYLRGMRAVADRTEAGWLIRVDGELVKEQPGDSLELYALIDGRHQDYQRVQTDELVSHVHFTVPWEAKSEAKEMTVRVDLVNVSTIWHTAESVVKLDE